MTNKTKFEISKEEIIISRNGFIIERKPTIRNVESVFNNG